MLVIGSIVHWVGHLAAGGWAALAAWATFGVAFAAGLIARRQLGEARELRKRQSQPYVAAFLEPSIAGSEHIELVIKNFGLTAATDVRVEIDPMPTRSQVLPLDEKVYVPDLIPTLVPGQEWRTYWDSLHLRGETELRKHHHVTVRFTDPYRTAYEPLVYDLDWEPVERRGPVTVYGLHHAADALRDVRNMMRTWSESGGAAGVSVYVRNGDERDARNAQQWAEWKATHEAEEAALRRADLDGRIVGEP